MRILVDTNILISAILFPRSRVAEMSYELVPAAYHAEKLIRDVKDQPILNAAIISNVDIILTGDKDFLCMDIEQPTCMNVTQFLEAEGVEI